MNNEQMNVLPDVEAVVSKRHKSVFREPHFWVFALVASSVLATPANAAIDLQSAIDALKDFITGTFAKSAAVIALAFQGYRFYSGRAGLAGLLAVIGGCFLIFGAEWILTKLGVS